MFTLNNSIAKVHVIVHRNTTKTTIENLIAYLIPSVGNIEEELRTQIEAYFVGPTCDQNVRARGGV